jgi:hypothetical protein
VPSHITVQTNGGNSEVFSISLPGDRIMSGQSGSASRVPPNLSWPELPALAGFEAELFKVRDRDGEVIGIGSRFLRSAGSGNSFVQWAVHLPARGTMMIVMDPNPAPGQARSGTLAAGTGEFGRLTGSVAEVFVRAQDSGDVESEGRIDLRATLIGPQEDAT